MSSSDTITPSPTSQSASTTVNLFPTTTTNSSNGNGLNQGSPTTYYFVFLGVLVVLLIIAASLAYRALRIRRQFRTATQIALMRGEPPPRLQDDYWALGVLSPWRMEDAMRQARNGEGRDGLDPEGGYTSRRGGKKTKWDRMPVLWEWEVRDDLGRDGEEEGEEGRWREKGFEGAMPVSLQSLDPPDPSPPPPPDPTPISSNRESILTSWRRDRDRSRPTDLASHVPIHGRVPISSPLTSSSTRPGRIREREMDRDIRVGEEMRTAVIIQMPFQEEGMGYWGNAQDGDSEDWEEKPGWRVGMELGVWEGTVGAQGKDL